MTQIDPLAPVVALEGAAAPLDRERCLAVARFLARLRAMAGGATAAAASQPPPDRLAAALLGLAGAGRLGFSAGGAGAAGTSGTSGTAGTAGTAAAPGAVDALEVLYTPSRAANLSVLAAAEETGTGFPEPVRHKQAEALRTSQGALLRFPPEEGGPPLEVFITDWSPCPAAAAVAVHRDHSWLAGTEKPAGVGFAGRYVRHPLTGDLLPVWVADWVRPDFGSGAVLVNPAHDPADLAFGRAVGLPIRFGLAPADFDDAPERWLTPPIVKTGVSIRTGRYDRLEAPTAMATYFEVLAGRGLAERVKDVQAGRAAIGRLVADPDGPLAWDPSRRRLSAARDAPPAAAPAPAGAPGSRMRLEAGELLAAAVATAPGEAPVVVCPAAEQTGALLYLRLLAFDIHGAPFAPGGVVLVQKTQDSGRPAGGAGPDAGPQAVALALLIGAPLAQVVVLKQQVLEQVSRFVRVHGELAAALDGGSGRQRQGAEASGEPPVKALARAKEAMLAAEPSRAFELVRQVQKQLAAQPSAAPAAALDDYLAAAWVLTGLGSPPGLAAAGSWGRL